MIAEIFWSQVEKTDSCWIWKGGRDRHGVYGRYGGRAAHRVAYRLTRGSIPRGLEIDHLCNTPLCVNPSHLEPVTRLENMRRRAERQTRCHKGHPFTPENTYQWGNHRRCRACQNETTRRYRLRKLAEAGDR